jgi:ABC-type antimicrobial peptide transport system permease subunit
MLFKRLFRRDNPTPAPDMERDSLNRGVSYFYLVIGLQVVLVFGVLFAIMIIGKVIATPFWVFVLLFGLGIAGLVFIYRKAKQQWLRFSETIQRVGPSARTLEISVMGGMLTMRVETDQRRLLEGGTDATPLIESEPIETPTIR